MAELSRKLDDLIRALHWAEGEMVRGRPREEVAADLGFTEVELQQLAAAFSVPADASATIQNCGVMGCVFPICRTEEESKPIQQTATGILLGIGPELFVLTASHVVNSDKAKDLLMPSVDGMSGIYGNLSYTIPDHQPDQIDRLDFAYIHLDRKMHSRVHPSIKPAQLVQLTPAHESLVGELYTFIGFPWRKSTSRRGVVLTDLFRFTGFVTSDEKYQALGCNRAEHIVVRFKRKRAFSARYNARKTSPHPQGISGGMALQWPRNPQHRGSGAVLKIGGVAHSFNENENCLVATSMHCVVSAIVGKHPELRHFVDECDDVLRQE